MDVSETGAYFLCVFETACRVYGTDLAYRSMRCTTNIEGRFRKSMTVARFSVEGISGSFP